MKRNSLFLFLSMMFVWVGLCSAQTSSDKYVLIDGCFFNGMPPGIRTDEGAQMIMLTDEEGHTALEIRLNKGKTLPDYAMKYRVSVEKVPGGEELLQISRSGAQKPMAIAATNTVTLDKWVGYDGTGMDKGGYHWKAFRSELLAHRLQTVYQGDAGTE